jgi:two-component system sensor histidine kinase BaeS
VALTITRKVFLTFSLVVLVVLGLGVVSLRATGQLYELNQTLTARAIPAIRLQRVLAERVPVLARHETRAVVLRDPAYRELHQEGVEEFQRQLEAVTQYLDDRQLADGLPQIRVRLAEYLALVEQEWTALAGGRRDEALRLSEGPTREAGRALGIAVEALLARSLVDLERTVAAGGKIERSVRTAAILGLAVTLAVGLGLAGMVTVRIVRPIRALQRATQEVARGGYDAPVTTRSHDEVGDLVRAFGDMTHKLREVDELKQEVFSNISHEFRSPLTSIRMAANLLRSGSLTPKQERWIEIIQSDSDKLLRLTNQILDLSKVRVGMLQLDLVSVDLRRVAESAAEEVRPVSEAKGVRLVLSLPAGPLRIVCVEHRTQQVFVNLLANAVKFTPTGGQIRLLARENGSELLVTVEDTGIGIPPDQLTHVFDRYQQAHGRRGGTGLGLAIVKAFVEAHGGRVGVESREGEGTRFSVTLPPGGGAR